jgi:hypothetical protein
LHDFSIREEITDKSDEIAMFIANSYISINCDPHRNFAISVCMHFAI